MRVRPLAGMIAVGVAALLLAPGIFGASAAEKPDVADVVQKLQKRYDSTADFTADFRQAVEVKTLGKTLETHGKVFFKRPGRMRWDFLEPERQTIVADGSTLWVHQPEHAQVLKTPFRLAFQSAMPVSFLFGVGKLAQDFDAEIASADAKRLQVRLVPKQEPEIGVLILTVDPSTYDILGAEVTDPLGNVTRLEFQNFRRDVGVADSQFVFEVPPGTDVVEAPTAPGS